MAWANPIVGGGNALIREELKSPDYQAGVSGWSIKKDGSAEFNDVDVRGTLELDGPDFSGLAIDVGGLGPSIFFLPERQGMLKYSAAIAASIDDTTYSSPRAYLAITGTGYSLEPGFEAPELIMYGETADNSVPPQVVIQNLNSGGTNDNVDFIVKGNAEIEGTFSRPGCAVSFGTPNIASGVVAQTLTLSVIRDSYGMWDADSPTVVTIVKDGLYEVGMVIRYGSQNPNANLRQMKFLVNGAEHMQWNFPAVSNMNGTNITLNGVTELELVVGDTITFQTLQNSGVALGIVANSRGWVRMVEG